jgi:hypothetical protein
MLGRSFPLDGLLAAVGLDGPLYAVFRSELLFHFECDGVSVHLVRTRRVTKNRSGIRPRSCQQHTCLHQQTGERTLPR